MTTPNLQPSLAFSEELPAPSKEVKDVIVRPDRNLEKWPIWEPSNSRHKPQARTIQREIRLPDGSKAVATVEVGFTNKGALTTEDQKTCYALIKYWENKGKPEEPVYFSRQQLARILHRQWGSKTNQALTASLMRLRFTPFTWERSYYDSTTRETVERIDTFNILAELHLSRRSKDGKESHTTTEASYFAFNERILRNLLSNHTKPVFLDTILRFKSEIAQILYTHLDLVLFDKSSYERRTKELFDDLGINGTAYRYPSKRAQTLEPALKELQDAPLPTGMIREVRLERTVDNTDFKIVVRKSKTRTPRAKVSPAAESAAPAVTKMLALPPVVPIHEAEPEADTAVLEQIRFFYQIFFRSGDNAHPTAKELNQASDHLSRLGEEKAQYIVTFALRESRRTKFNIQTYGGICQYEGRAVAEYEANAQKRAEAILEKARKSHQERFYAAYLVYVGETLREREKTPSKAFLAFLAQEKMERGKFEKGPLAKHPTMQRVLRDFDQEEARLKRFSEFFAANAPDGILDFWDWDRAYNPERFTSPS